MLEKLQTFTEGRYDLSRTDLDNIYDEQLGDVGSTLEALPVVQRQVSTAKLMAQAGGPGGLGRAGSTAGSSIGRTASTSSYGAGAKAPLGRQTSTSSVGKTMPPPVRGTGGAAVAPPAYTPPPAGSDVGANPAGAKRAPPPPPPLKPKPSYGAAPAVKYVVALFDFEAQAAGDLSFSVGDRIELVERTGSAEDWWTGRVDGRQGVFPGKSFLSSLARL
jgi:amphiphysin